jgi:SAM-dependent methyltransferase
VKGRPIRSEVSIERARRERYAPRPWQWDYLHLKGLLSSLQQVLGELPATRAPVLDLYCGTQPYRDLIPWRPLFGVDIDRHFGRADVVAHGRLPFRDAAFGLVVCTQALHLVEDPLLTVAEMARVVKPGGYTVVTVPHLFRRDVPFERRWNQGDLEALFAPWGQVEIRPVGGPGTGLAYVVGHLLAGPARLWSPLEMLLRALALPINMIGSAMDALLVPASTRWPAMLTLVARRGSA